MVKIRDTYIDETRIESVRFVYVPQGSTRLEIMSAANEWVFDDITPTEQRRYAKKLGIDHLT